MNFMIKGKDSNCSGYYEEDYHHNQHTSKSSSAAYSSSDLQILPTTLLSPNFHYHSNTGAPPPELNLMNKFPCLPPSDNRNNSSKGIDIERNHDKYYSGTATSMVVEREHMFDKVVTPSDVGKLNRLVIPKQHAERYFPLDSDKQQQGLFLNFEDMMSKGGKSWRFRYSYWNSSQSYVMTKGWSRFVKDTKLDAGDIISFHRAKDRLFINWSRPPVPHHDKMSFSTTLNKFSPIHSHCFPASTARTGIFFPAHNALISRRANSYNDDVVFGYKGGTNNTSISTNNDHVVVNYHYNSSEKSVIYYRSATAITVPHHHQQQASLVDGTMRLPPCSSDQFGIGAEKVLESVPVFQRKIASAKRLRLFGVDMNCTISQEDDGEHDTSILPPITVAHHQNVVRTSPSNADLLGFSSRN